MRREFLKIRAARPLRGLACASLIGFAAILLPGAESGKAADLPLTVVSGSFVYEVAVAGEASSAISYRVEPADYHGIRAWRIAWSDARMEAEHLIRQGDGAPLYTIRINYPRHERVEIHYSLDAQHPSIYRRVIGGETLVKRIHARGLVDLGTLPQVLAGLQSEGGRDELHFKAIDYTDGSVYELLAKRVGDSTVDTQGRPLPCTIYETNLDSWMAAFNPSVRLQVPNRQGVTNFAAYAGPDPAGGGETATLRMISASSEVAVLTMDESALAAH